MKIKLTAIYSRYVVNKLCDTGQVQPKCQHQWSSPTGCSGTSCDYQASWRVNLHNVTFTITAKQANTRWTGIGFAKDARMVKFL